MYSYVFLGHSVYGKQSQSLAVTLFDSPHTTLFCYTL